jgi:hypothetical protein
MCILFFAPRNDANEAWAMTTIEQITRLLSVAREQAEQQRRKWTTTATRFNIFNALAIEDLELPHSKFIAFLLDPREQHDQGDRFLQSFLKLTRVLIPEHLHVAEVFTESTIPKGRLDILVRIPPELTLCIENKVWAGDQEDQIGKYLVWLNSSSVETPSRALIFLTRTGSAPQGGVNNSFASQLRLLSYSALADWLERQVVTVPDRLGVVIKMYVQSIKRIVGGKVSNPYPNELAALLTSPENLEAALMIVECVNDQRPLIAQRFWDNVKQRLTDQLTASSFGDNWSIVAYKEVMDRYSGLSMVPSSAVVKSEGNGRVFTPCYAVGIEALTNNPEDCFYGVRRPTPLEPTERNRLDLQICEELGESGFRNSATIWGAWKRASEFGVPRGSQGMTKWIAKLNMDNKAIGTPLAKRIADGLWDLFLLVRARIEELNSSPSNLVQQR